MASIGIGIARARCNKAIKQITPPVYHSTVSTPHCRAGASYSTTTRQPSHDDSDARKYFHPYLVYHANPYAMPTALPKILHPTQDLSPNAVHSGAEIRIGSV